MQNARAQLSGEQRRVVERIRRRYHAGEPLNISAVKRSDPGLLYAAYAVRPFWGWRRALHSAGIRYSNVRVDLQDHVVCRVCGKVFSSLSGHLSKAHGYEAPIAPDYRREFPGAPILSEQLRAHYFGRNHLRGRVPAKRLIGHWEPVWTPEYALDRVAELFRRGCPLNYDHVLANEPGLINVGLKYFGSWDETLARAGLTPDDIRLIAVRQDWTRQRVLRKLRQRKAAGRSLNFQAVKSEDSRLWSAIQRLYGAHDGALRAAGFNPQAQRVAKRRRFTERDRQRLLAAIRRTARTSGAVRERAIRNLRRRFQPEIVCLYRKAWARAARDAGVEPACIRLPRTVRYPTRAAVVAGIRARRRKKQPLNYRAVAVGTAADIALLRHAQAFFRSWDNALRAAGLDPGVIRLKPARQA